MTEPTTEEINQIIDKSIKTNQKTLDILSGIEKLTEEEETKLWYSINELRHILYVRCNIGRNERLNELKIEANRLINIIEDLEFRKVKP